MSYARRTVWSLVRSLIVPLLLLAAGGCQAGQAVRSERLVQHQAFLDFSGLAEPAAFDDVRIRASIPRTWKLHGAESKTLYNHRQWKAPSGKTGAGVVYARLPLPVSPKVLLWMVRQQFADRAADGKELGRWVDAMGRHWFEAENPKYHARGYAMVDGRDAWIVYFGYKVDAPPVPGEISDAARCVETFVPVKVGEPTTKPGPATAPVASR